MRTKRAQRRRAKAPKTVARPSIPDLFSQRGPEMAAIVDEEVYLSDLCPCCIDRELQIQLDREARDLIQWAKGSYIDP